jgi:hypothetical protein
LFELVVAVFYQDFNLFDDRWEIGLSKTQSRRWYTIVFNVRRRVIVVRVSGRKRLVIRVRKIVVPVNSLAAAIDFVAISGDQCGVEIEFLSICSV